METFIQKFKRVVFFPVSNFNVALLHLILIHSPLLSFAFIMHIFTLFILYVLFFYCGKNTDSIKSVYLNQVYVQLCIFIRMPWSRTISTIHHQDCFDLVKLRLNTH